MKRSWPVLALYLLPVAVPAAPVSVVDDVGATVVVQSVPRRIVSLSPGATELLFALGAGDRVVGTCSLCDAPKAALACPHVGDFSHPSLEAILAKRPDLIIATGGPQRELVMSLRAGSIPTLVLYPPTLGAVFSNIDTLGKVLGRSGAAESLSRSLHRRIASLTASGSGHAPAAAPVVYFEIWADPLMAIGDASYPGELIRLAGGANVTKGMAGEYPRLTAEAVMAANPDVIILSHCDDPAGALATVARRPGWAHLKAVTTKRVYADLDMNLLVRPGPRLAEGLEMLIRKFRASAP